MDPHRFSLPKIVAVIGPTASGKTSLGCAIAQHFGGEIISADSKQVYKGLDIGTAKEKDLPVKQHLIDLIMPMQRMTVAEYQQLAYGVIDELLAQQTIPIIVGGSGLYAEAVLEGYVFGEGQKSTLKIPRYNSLVMGLEIEKEVLFKRVEQRTLSWLDDGLLEEIQDLLDQGVSREWLEQNGMEYRWFTKLVFKEVSLDEALQRTNLEIRQFIKRQYTWWRRHPEVLWVRNPEEALERVEVFLN